MDNRQKSDIQSEDALAKNKPLAKVTPDQGQIQVSKPGNALNTDCNLCPENCK